MRLWLVALAFVIAVLLSGAALVAASFLPGAMSVFSHNIVTTAAVAATNTVVSMMLVTVLTLQQ